MRARWALLVIVTAAGCGGGGGIGPGSTAVVDSPLATYKDPKDDSRTIVVDGVTTYRHRDGARRLDAAGPRQYLDIYQREAVALEDGTPVKVARIDGDMALVLVRGGRHEGEAVWVATRYLKAK